MAAFFFSFLSSIYAEGVDDNLVEDKRATDKLQQEMFVRYRGVTQFIQEKMKVAVSH